MVRLAAGIAIGVLLTCGLAEAGVTGKILAPAGSTVTVQPGAMHEYVTVVKFPGIDLSCTYERLQATPGPLSLEQKGSPMLSCDRASTPGSSTNPTATQSRTVLVTKFRYYVTDSHGSVVYRVVRAP
jgi:hypothetical protein